MGLRTRELDIKAGAAKVKADKAARLEAELVVDRWNRRLATGRDMLVAHRWGRVGRWNGWWVSFEIQTGLTAPWI
jgi:hypothetical protein